jgi:hypothetical protein
MSTMHDGGKGDAPRPFSVDLEKFAENFDLIFGKKEKRTEPIPFAGMVDIGESEDEQD